MKKLTTLIAALFALSLLAGCGGGAQPAETPEPLSLPADGTLIARGEVTETSYRSESAGFAFTLPEGWMVCSDAEIAYTLNVKELNQGLSAPEDLTGLHEVTDTIAFNRYTGEVLYINYHSLVSRGVEDAGSFLSALAEENADSTELLKGPYAFTLGGQEFWRIDSQMGGPETIRTDCARVVGNHLLHLTLITQDFIQPDDFFACFTGA